VEKDTALRVSATEYVGRVSRQIGDGLPPRLGLGLRAWKNRSNLFGLHAPASALVAWVPPGMAALDIGANRGLYAHWIAKRAAAVHAFEPNPAVYDYLARAAGKRVVAYNVALSNANGVATLWVPAGDGEASLRQHDGPEDARPVQVEQRRLDDYHLDDIGFAKIDVEGHEWEVLQGGIETLRRWLPTLFVEMEERHRSGAVERVANFLQGLGYGHGFFMRQGQFHRIEEFDQEQDQLRHLPDVSSPDYVSNFLFPGRVAVG